MKVSIKGGWDWGETKISKIGGVEQQDGKSGFFLKMEEETNLR